MPVPLYSIQDLFISKGNEGFDLTLLQKKKIISLKGKWHFIWNKYVDPKEIIEKDDKVKVKILDVSAEEKRLSLGIKQLEQNHRIRATRNSNKNTIFRRNHIAH